MAGGRHIGRRGVVDAAVAHPGNRGRSACGRPAPGTPADCSRLWIKEATKIGKGLINFGCQKF